MARILVADDDADVRSLVARYLARAGHEVVEAVDGRGCLDVLRTTPLDLIICDIYMPDVDGIAVIAQAHRDFPHVPILAISGGGTVPQDRTLEIAERLGATRTLTKPFDPDALMASVRELLPAS